MIDQFPGRKIYVGKKEGNKLENIIVFEVDDNSLPIRVTYARTGKLEADLENKRILMHLYDARYQQRDEKNPLDLRKIRDGISMAEGTLPISLDELYEKEKKRPSRSAATTGRWRQARPRPDGRSSPTTCIWDFPFPTPGMRPR